MFSKLKKKLLSENLLEVFFLLFFWILIGLHVLYVCGSDYKIFSNNNFISKYGINIIIIIIYLIYNIVIITTLILKKTYKSKYILFGLIAFIYIMFLFLLQIGDTPDEPNHFYKAYSVSEGTYLAKHISNDKTGGDILPSNIQNFYIKDEKVNEDKTEIAFPNTAIYSFILYIPSALGIKISKIFINKFYIMFRFARIFNLLFNLLLIYVIFNLIHNYSQLFVFYTIPSVIQSMVACTIDGIVINCCVLFLAYLYYLNKIDVITNKHIIYLIIIISVISMSKYVFFPYSLLVLMLPNKKINVKNPNVYKLSIIISQIILALITTLISSTYLTNFNVGINIEKQIIHLMCHPVEGIIIFYRTIENCILNWIKTCFIGIGGSTNINISTFPLIIHFLLLQVFVVKSIISTYKTKNFINYLTYIIYIIIFFLTLLTLYITWTPVYAKVIIGFQGRYFLPIIPLLLMSNYNEQKNDKENKYIFSAITSVFIVAIDILVYYAST